MADATSPDLEGDSEELDDCVDEDAFSSVEDEDDGVGNRVVDPSHVMPTPILIFYLFFRQPTVVTNF